MLLSTAFSRVQEASHDPCPVHTPGAGPAAILSPHPSHFTPSGRADTGDAPGTARPVPAGGPLGPPAVSAAAARWSRGSAACLHRGDALPPRPAAHALAPVLSRAARLAGGLAGAGAGVWPAPGGGPVASRAQSRAAVQAVARGGSTSQRDAVRPAGAGRALDGPDACPRCDHRQRPDPRLAPRRSGRGHRTCPCAPPAHPTARLSAAYPPLSRDQPAAALPALPPLARQRPRCSLRPAAVGTGRPPVHAATVCHPSGCGLLGTETDRLDPHRAEGAGRDPVESQAAEAA